MPERINLGRIMPIHRGDYSSNTTYEKMDVVKSGGATYWCKQQCTGVTPPNDTYWVKLADRGEDGTNGQDGADGLDAYQPFKGWYDTSSSLSTAFPTPQVGDYAYVVGASSSDPVTIYKCATAGTWAASSSTFNPANNQEFASGQSLNTVNIVDNLNSSSATDVLSAKQGKELKSAVDALGHKIDGYVPQTLTIEQGGVASADGTNSSSNTRIRTNGYINHSTIKVEIASGKYFVFGYDANGYVGADTASWRTSDAIVSLYGCTKYRIVFAKENNSNVSPSDFQSLGIKVYGYDESAKEVVLKQDLANALGSYNTAVDLSSIERHSNKIITDAGKWRTSANAQIIFVPLSGVLSINVSTTTYELIYAFMTSNNIGSNNDSADIVDGESRNTIAVNTTASIDVPEGALYLYMHVRNADGTDKLSSYSLAVTSGVYGDIRKVANQSQSLVNSLVGMVDMSESTDKIVKGLSFRRDMVRVNSSVYDGHIAIDIAQYSRVKVKTPVTTSTSSNTKATGYILHNDYDPALAVNTTAGFGDFTKNSIVAYAIFTYGAEENGTEFREFDTNGAKYLSLPFWNDENAALYGKFEAYGYVDASNVWTIINLNSAKVNDLKKRIDDGDISGDSIRDVPKNITVLNAYKKAKQMLNVKWSCVANGMASKNGASTYAQGNYTGVPYSSVKEIYTFIPRNVSFRTFVTAAHNPYSLLYSENVSAGNTASAIDKTYHGTNCGTYMGGVCSSLTSYALGTRLKYDTSDMRAMPELFERVYDQSSQGVELMDVIVNATHTRLITDIYRTKRGVVTKIVTIEEVGNVQEKEWTPSAFDTMMNDEGYAIYRYTELFKNTSYEQSEVVSVTDEGEEDVTFAYNEDICTFKGDKCTFKEGDTIRINFFDGNYTAMELYKDDVLLDTITTLDSSTHYVDLTSRNLSYGKYKARMIKSDSSYSDYTTFEIIDCNVSYDSATNTITFSSHNAVARAAMYVTTDGTRKQILDLNDTASGSVAFVPSFSTSGINVYLIVEFFGDYGGTISNFINTGL